MPDKLKPDQAAPDFTLPATAGGTVHLADELKKQPATVVLFICNHCPYVQAYIPRLIKLQNEFAGKARFIGIASNDPVTYPEDSFDKMKEYTGKWGLNFPYVHDADQSIAHAYGAERTPEIFVLDQKGVCRYEGGVDDNYQNEAKVADRPLRDALVAVTTGGQVKKPQSYAIGCSIKWKK